MKRLMLLLLFAVGLQAQTCTPVKESINYTHLDDGTGPNLFIQIDGTRYPAYNGTNGTPMTINSRNSGHNVGSAETEGWVDLRGGFGGCTLSSWEYVSSIYFQITDVSNPSNPIVIYTSSTATNTASGCGFVSACGVPPGGPSGVPFDYIWFPPYALHGTPGHAYQVTVYTNADVVDVGISPWYSGWVNIHVI